MVFSAMHFNESLPIWTYRGFFQRIVLATERLWSYAHGWEPTSHIRDFGHFYAPMVRLICPLIGFAVFWMVSRSRAGVHTWKPIGIALLATLAPDFIALAPFYALGLQEQWVQVIRTLLIVSLMVWSHPRPGRRPARLN
jgi:hypothetical protein